MTARSSSASATVARGRCPVCGGPSDPATRPFCGLRCADVDLGRWLTGQYRIPGVVSDEDPDQPPPSPPSPDAA